MAQVTILDAQTNVTTGLVYPAISSGADRKAILIFACSAPSTVGNITSITIGGVSPTLEIGTALGAVTGETSCSVFSLNESQISAMSGNAIVLSGGSYERPNLIALSVKDTIQSATIDGGYYNSGSTSVSAGATPPFSRVADSWTLFLVHLKLLASATMSNPSGVQSFSTASTRTSVGYAADTARTIASSYTSSSTRATATALNFQPAPSQLINSTNSGANDLNAGTVNTASVTGYVVGVNPVVSGTVGSLALTSVSQSGGIVSATIPAPVNDSYWPEPDTSHTLTLTDGSNPATFDAVMNSLAGYTSIVAVSPDLADPHKIPYWLTSTAVDGDRIMYKTADMTVAADWGISGATLGVTTIYYHWRVADSKIYAYEALLDEEGIATSTGITARGLSVSGLTVRGLTVRGLGGAAAMVGGFPYLLPFLLS